MRILVPQQNRCCLSHSSPPKDWLTYSVPVKGKFFRIFLLLIFPVFIGVGYRHGKLKSSLSWQAGRARQYKGNMEKPTQFPGRLDKVCVFDYDQVGIKISLHLLIHHSLLTLSIWIQLEGLLQVKVFTCIKKSISVDVTVELSQVIGIGASPCNSELLVSICSICT